MSNQPSLWDQTGGKVGHDHPQTSHTAAANVKSGSQHAQILIALYTVWPTRGMTGYDLSDIVVNSGGRTISANQCCTRLLELREKGLVEFMREFPDGPIVEAETTPGNTGQIHVLTDAGIKKAIALGHVDNPGVADYGTRSTRIGSSYKNFKMNERKR